MKKKLVLTNLFFRGIKFAGHNTDTVLISFFYNQFAKASVYIKPPLESKAISLYEGIVKDLNSKYFITSDSFKTYDFPYEKNDGYTETAISLGKAEFSSFWKFSNYNKIDDFLSVRIDEGLDIVVTYEHGDLTQKFVDRIKEDQSLYY